MRFLCSQTNGVQPIFDMHNVTAEEKVTISAGGLTRRNYTTKVVGHTSKGTLREVTFAPQRVLALPSGHYGLVTIVVHQGTEARAIDAQVKAELASGSACFVKQWLVKMNVRPY